MSTGAKLEYLKETKRKIKEAIESKDPDITISAEDTFRSYADRIREITTVAIDSNFQEKTVTPTAEGLDVVADNGFDALSKVIVEGDSNLSAENIKQGVSIFGVTGTLEGSAGEGGGIGSLQSKNVIPTAEGVTVTADEGYSGLSEVIVAGDENLIAGNVRAGVEIFGVTGVMAGGGSNIMNVGSEVTVQAQDDFDVGDTFVGTKIDGVTQTIVEETTGVTASLASADTSVIIPSQTLTATSTQVNLYVNVDGIYTEMIIDLPDMTGASSRSISSTYATINEDGTKMMFMASTSFVLEFEINKTSLSGSCYKINISDINIPFTDSNTIVRVFTNYAGKIRSDFWVFGIMTNKGYCSVIGRVSTGTISNAYASTINTSSGYATIHNTSGLIDVEDGKVLLFITGTGSRGSCNLYKAKIEGKQVVSCISISIQGENFHLTKNGKYILATPTSSPYTFTVYKVNKSTLTLTTIKTVTGGNNSRAYIDEAGEYWIAGSKLYSINDPNRSSSLGTMYAPVEDCYFDARNGYIYSDKKITLVPSGDAEYIITHTKDIIENGDIYGVIVEDVESGEIKTARKLFGTS